MSLTDRAFSVGRESSRMGVRLCESCVGAEVAIRERLGALPSRVTVAGAIQVPPDGRPIVLGADAQTIGGYAVVAHVIGADLPILAQLRPGDAVRFAVVSMESARAALEAQRRAIAKVRARVLHA
jgi:antagonist of KipI